MSISIHGNLQNQTISPVKAKSTTEGKEFSLPILTESGFLEGSIKELPKSILEKSEKRKEEIEYRGQPLFTVEEDGSFKIREGLTKADYERAMLTIRSWQMMMERGGTIGL